jgi:hypothetical protein
MHLHKTKIRMVYGCKINILILRIRFSVQDHIILLITVYKPQFIDNPKNNNMTRTIYLIALLLPPALIGLLLPLEQAISAFKYLVIFYIPVITLVRMRKIGMNGKEMLKSLVPFLGFKNQWRPFERDKK